MRIIKKQTNTIKKKSSTDTKVLPHTETETTMTDFSDSQAYAVEQVYAVELEQEIRLVAGYRSAMQCRIGLSVTFGLFLLYSAAIAYITATPLYLFLFLNIVPWLLEMFLSSVKKLSFHKKIVLPELRKHYHYNTLRYTANRLTLLIVFFLLILWQSVFHRNGLTREWLTFTPVVCMAWIVISRTLLPLFLAHRMKKRLLSGRI